MTGRTKSKAACERSGTVEYAILLVTEVKNQARKETVRAGVYSGDPCYRYLFYTPVLEMAIRFWKKGQKKDSLLKIVDYSVGGETTSQSSEGTNEMSTNFPLPREEVLYRMRAPQEPGSRQCGG